jgi:hypothetical protein
MLSRLARAALPLADFLPLLPQQARCRSPLTRSRSPARAHPFPQPLWTTPEYGHECPRRDSRWGVPSQWHGASLAPARLVAS